MATGGQGRIRFVFPALSGNYTKITLRWNRDGRTMEQYFGIFERIRNEYPDKINEMPLYYRESTDFYDRMARGYRDYPNFLQQARIHGGPILELCCGTGRITLPLLKEGFEITAVDLSEDMLGTLKKRVSSERRYRKYEDHLTVLCQDMTKLCLEDRYNLVIIAATSIRLMEDDFQGFFDSIYELLNPGGAFYFNFEDLPVREDEKEYLEPMNFGDLPDDTGDMVLTALQRKLDYGSKRAYVNFLELRTPGRGRQLLSHTDYRIFGAEDIRRAGEASRFRECILQPCPDQDVIFCKLVK
jgi:SAM-dependent methyltransferase